MELNSSTPVYDHIVFRVVADKKQDISEELKLLGIDRETLFPSLHEAATSVMNDVTQFWE